MRRGLDMDKIASALGAARQGKVSATGGYFGALQLLADIHGDLVADSGRESSAGDTDLVFPGKEVRCSVKAVLIGRDYTGEGGGLVLDGDSCFWNDRATGIDDGAQNCAASDLRDYPN